MDPRATQALSLTPGAVVAGRYRVLEQIGEGGYSSVYVAEPTSLAGDRVALKVLKAGADPRIRERFQREARMLLKLRHPAIVTVRDYFDEPACTGYAMDLVAGPTLRRLLDERGPLAPERAAARAVDVLAALEHAHQAGVVHRDLKPANLLIADAGQRGERAMVVDFGIAKVMQGSAGGDPAGLTGDRIVGTPKYLSPEQASGDPVDGRADLYSLGCVLFEMLAGRAPFTGASPAKVLFAHMETPPPLLAEAAPGRAFPAGIEAVLRRALEKDPARRFPSAAEMREALLPFAARGPRTARVGSDERLAAPTPAPARPAEGIDLSRPLEGQQVGPYRVLRKLDEGAFGTVCEAEDVALGRRAALKLLKPEMAAEPEFVERFRREGRVLASLDHEAIVRVWGAGESGGMLYLAMEFCEGETLAKRLKRTSPLAVADAARLLRPVAEALAAAHAKGVVHRDLKPDNVYVFPDGRVKVLDFGIAAVLRSSKFARLTRQGMVIGTPAFMAPEQAMGEEIDHRADLYALGVILFEALTGLSPFPSATTAEQVMHAHVHAQAPSLAAARPDRAFPEKAEALVSWALAKARENRVPDARTFAAALAALSAGTPARGLAAIDAVPAGHLSRGPPRPADHAAPLEGDRTPGAASSGHATLPLRGPTRDAPAYHATPPPEWGSVGDSGIASREMPLPQRTTPAPVILPRRARLAIDSGLSLDGLETVHVTAAPRLRFGRSKPGQADAAAENTLVLRVLPCRSEREDPENFRATQGISQSHATIEPREGALHLLDHSRAGTSLDGRRLDPARPERLPPRFTLRVGDALEMEGRIAAGPGGAPAALLLLRRSNLPRMGYLWVLSGAAIGPGEGAALRLRAGSGRIDRDGDALRFALPPGVAASASEVGEETKG